MKILELVVKAHHSDDAEKPTVLIDNARMHTLEVVRKI